MIGNLLIILAIAMRRWKELEAYGFSRFQLANQRQLEDYTQIKDLTLTWRNSRVAVKPEKPVGRDMADGTNQGNLHPEIGVQVSTCS